MIKVKRNMKAIKLAVETIERHPVPVFGIDYKVKIAYKNIKIAELDVEKTTIKISLPNKYKKQDSKTILDIAIEKMYEQIAKVEIENVMEKMRIMLGFAPEDFEVKKMKNILGKCENKKITINTEIVKFSRDIIEYIVLHQYCHLKYKNHCKSFYELIANYQPNYEEYEEFLNSSTII